MGDWKKHSEAFLRTDSQIAELVLTDFALKYGEGIIFDEGNFYSWIKTHWSVLEEHDITRAILAYDATSYRVGKQEKFIRLSAGTVKSIRHFMQMLSIRPGFFAKATLGINVKNGFITFGADGPAIRQHLPSDRRRSVLEIEWHPEKYLKVKEEFYARHFLQATFFNASQKLERIDLIGQIMAGGLMGYGAELQTVFFFKGEKAGNGKSTTLKIMKAFMPLNTVSHLTLSQMSSDHMVVKMAGKHLNLCFEVDYNQHDSARFKSLSSGDVIVGRDVYKSAVEIIPYLVFVFACNRLPDFIGGLDPGIRRRVRIIEFENVIGSFATSEEELIKEICITSGELYLGWIVECGWRLIRERNYILLNDNLEQLHLWENESDIILAFKNDCLEERISHGFVTTSFIYDKFRLYAESNGIPKFKIPSLPEFSKRLTPSLKVATKHRMTVGKGFKGLKII